MVPGKRGLTDGAVEHSESSSVHPGAMVYTSALGPLCAGVLSVILVTGLWPFRAPKNDVTWLGGENGLRFGQHGIVTSTAVFRARSQDGACSLEIWLAPEGMKSSTILAFDSSPDPKFVFALRQFGDALAIQRARVDARGALVRPWLKTNHVFEKGKRVLLTITGSPEKTMVYVNGRRANVSSGFGLVNGDLTGQLVLGNSAIKDSWSGQIIGLAVNDFELTPLQVADHFEYWTHQKVPAVSGEKTPFALYLFDEGKGYVVHDRMGSGNDLVIRARYFVLHPAFLHPAWDQFRSRWDGWMRWSYWSDVFLNVAGFIPLGFFFLAYFSLVRPVSRPQVLVVVLGLTISLMIEILQHFLPTRDSSMTDVITNTLGTVTGVAFYRPALMSKLLNPRSLMVSLSQRWRISAPPQRSTTKEPRRNCCDNSTGFL